MSRKRTSSIHELLAPQEASIVFVGRDAMASRFRSALADTRMVNSWHACADCGEATVALLGDETEEPLFKPYVVLLQADAPGALAFIAALRRSDHGCDTVVFVLCEDDVDDDLAAFYRLNVAGCLSAANAGELVELLRCYTNVVSLPLDRDRRHVAKD